MADWVNVALLCTAMITGLTLGSFGFRAWRAGESRAARFAAVAILIAALLFLAALLGPRWVRTSLLALAAVAALAVCALSLAPIGRITVEVETPKSRVDERDIPFARMYLEPGTPRYEEYYMRRPELKALDERIRELPGLLSLRAKQADPMPFAATRASFQLIKGLRDRVDGDHVPIDPALSRIAHDMPAAALSDWIKKLALYYGAHSVGITALRDYHIYTHIGRGAGTYGEPIALPHTHAIAVTVEMAYEMVRQGPGAGTVMESAKQYVNAAQVALQLTYLLRLCGFSARAHIDENYRVICPLVARDAGLGEIGRAGLLITPDLGPRVRIAVVTTDAPLVSDLYKPDAPIIDFCTFCLKCADNCPAGAIPSGERQEYDGALRWRIDANACFRYWNIVGTDCGRCLAVCPYSRPPSYAPLGAQKLFRGLIRRSGFLRRAMLWLDDFFYGRKPRPRTSFYMCRARSQWATNGKGMGLHISEVPPEGKNNAHTL